MPANANQPSLTDGARRGAPPLRRLPRALVLAMAASTICFVILNMHLPVAILANAAVDDALFVKNAMSIVARHWLGPYDQYTLAKGPGYAIFLAFNAILGIPVTLTQALLYSGSCALLAVTLYRMFGAPWVCLASYLLMQWHPAMFPIRIVRDDLSAAQVLLLLGCVCHFLFLPTRLRNRLAWAAAGGVVLGWFWMTREDALWVLPGLAVMGLLQALRVLPRWREVRRLIASIIVFGVATLGTLSVVAAINLLFYKTFEIVDVKSPAFTRTLDVLQSVRVGAPVPYVPVPAKVRRQLDLVSPAFASLEPYFHGQGQMWTQPGCQVYPSTCNDIAGGWFMWALRDAVASEGDYRTPRAAAAFYRRLWTQVDVACKNRRLVCRKTLLPFMPAMRSDQWQELPAEIWRMCELATWQFGQTNWLIHERSLLTSSGSATQIQSVQEFLGNPKRAPTPDQMTPSTVAGWFRAPNHSWLRVRCVGAQGTVILPVMHEPSPDLVRFFHSPDAADQRFDVALPSLRGCLLEPVPVSPTNGFVDLANAVIGSTSIAGGTLALDAMSVGAAGSTGARALGLLEGISRFYGWIVPGATVLALLVYIGSLFWALLRDRRLDAQLIMLTGIGTLLLARATLLVLVDISSFPGIAQSYWGAGYPLLSLAIVLSLGRFFLETGQDGDQFCSGPFPETRVSSRLPVLDRGVSKPDTRFETQ